MRHTGRQSRHEFFVAGGRYPAYLRGLKKGCRMDQTPSTQEALIYLMVIMSASDREMSDAGLARIGSMIRTLPVFSGFDEARIIEVARECQERLQQENGPDRVLDIIRDVVPTSLHDTAYSLAVEVAAADLYVE